MEKIPSASRLPVRTAVLASVSTAFYLSCSDGGSESFASVGLSLTLPVWFVFIQDWLKILRESPPPSKLSLNNMECQLILNVGREPGTFMAKEWGASGARLVLPLRVCFSDE
eukprot:2846718-Prymnesium_polylepis.1